MEELDVARPDADSTNEVSYPLCPSDRHAQIYVPGSAIPVRRAT